ncbi:MAG TPA: hypothetical protein VIV11_08090 [Kofleriaceae bacterium]
MRARTALMCATLATSLGLAGCGFDKPTDRCEGPCGLFAIDRPLTNDGVELWLEGTFEDGALVNFPGAAQPMSLDIRFDHRAATTVPPDATAGDLTLTTTEGVTRPIPFRLTTFKQTLQPFMTASEQSDYARQTTIERTFAGGVALTIKDRLYTIGGVSSGAISGNIEMAHAGLDGSIGRLALYGQLQMARAHHSALVIGGNVYVFGGLGAGADSIERASIGNDGALSPFGVVTGITIPGGRSGHATAIIGNYVYLFGGKTAAGADVPGVERALIRLDDTLGPFEPVPGVNLKTPRSNFSVARMGLQLFVIGGFTNGVPTDSVERIELYGSGGISDFEPAGKLLLARGNHASIVVGEDVFVLGGTGVAGTLTSVERAPIFQQQTLMFTAEAGLTLNVARQEFSLAVVGNYVQLIGGNTDGSGSPALQIERGQMIDVGTLATFTTVTTTLMTPRQYHASFVVGRWLYVVGGLTGGGAGTVLQTIEIAEINPDGSLEQFSTYQRSALMKARYGHSIFVTGREVFVLGGFDSSHNPIPSIESATIEPDGGLTNFATYAPVMNMPSPRGRFTTFAGVQLYVMGGVEGPAPVQPTATIAVGSFNVGYTLYEMNTSGALDVAREGAASIALGTYVYVISGVDDTTFRGNTRAPLQKDFPGITGAFTTYANSLQAPREGHVLVRVGNTLYVIGGVNAGGAALIESAKIGPDHALPPFTASNVTLNSARANHTTVTLGNYVYVIGGSTGTPLVSLEAATIR